MNRLDFIKRLVVATAAVAAIPILTVAKDAPSPIPQPDDYGFAFKVSREMLEEADSLGHIVDLAVQMRKIPSGYSLCNIIVGYDGEDFVRDLQTVVLRFKKNIEIKGGMV